MVALYLYQCFTFQYIIMQIIQSIQNRIYKIRSERVMLDKDVAALYETEAAHLTEVVKRNIKGFPTDFLFQLAPEEWENMRSQIVTTENVRQSLRPGNAALKIAGRDQRSDNLPYAFTGKGVAMLSGLLNSDMAINMNIAIIRAFVEIRRIVLQQSDLKTQLQEIKQHLGSPDTQLNQIYDAMENLLDEKAAQQKWEERERIGFGNK